MCNFTLFSMIEKGTTLIKKANCDMKTAEFSTVRKSGCYFFTCCKGWKAFSAVASLKKKYERLKRSSIIFNNICILK